MTGALDLDLDPFAACACCKYIYTIRSATWEQYVGLHTREPQLTHQCVCYRKTKPPSTSCRRLRTAGRARRRLARTNGRAHEHEQRRQQLPTLPFPVHGTSALLTCKYPPTREPPLCLPSTKTALHFFVPNLVQCMFSPMVLSWHTHQRVALDPLDGFGPRSCVRRGPLSAEGDHVAPGVNKLRPSPDRPTPTARNTGAKHDPCHRQSGEEKKNKMVFIYSGKLKLEPRSALRKKNQNFRSQRKHESSRTPPGRAKKKETRYK